MKKNFKSISLIAAFAAFAALSPAAASAHCCDQCMDGQEHHRMHGQERHHHFGMMATKLGLSAQQKQDVKNVFEKSRTQRDPLMQQLEKERHELMVLTHGDTVNDAAIRSQAAKIASVQADLAILRARTMQQVRALLTPEQAKKLKDLREKREHGPGHHHHRFINHCEQDN